MNARKQISGTFTKVILFLLISFSFLNAQKKEFTYEDIIFNSYGKLAPKRLAQLNWDKENPRFYWVENDTLKIENVSGEEAFFTLSEVNAALNLDSANALKRFPRISAMQSNQILFWHDTNFVSLDLKEHSAMVLFSVPVNAENITLSPDYHKAAFTIENNLFYVSKEGVKQITNEENPDIISGQTVSRNEFGISGGIFWSPKSDKIAFYRKDVSNVTDYPILDISVRPAKVKFVKYPMNGMKSEILSVGIYDLETNKTLFLNTDGEKEQYLTSLTWGPNEKYFYVAHLNRLQNHMVMKKYSVNSGDAVKILFEEKSDKYVEPEFPLYFIDDDEFVWLSRRDGWRHLYLYDTEGNLLKQLTHGDWEVLEVAKIIDDDEILISATKENPMQKHYYLVEVDSGEMEKLTSEHGQHKVIPNNDGEYFLDTFTSIDVPRKTLLLDEDGEVIRTLLEAENPIADYALGERKFFTIKNDGVTLYCRMILPVDFDENKKYPVIVYVYGGPHVQLVKDAWPFGRYDFWFYKMAQNGYVVFTLDNRGSANRGLEFEQATWHKLGTVEIQDQLAGVKYLKSLPFVDSTRIGVFGWSYGGYMTTSLMTRTNAFKVGVAGGAVIDWRYYEIMYGERYMGTEATNHEGMEEASLLNHVNNLNGHLLMVHGTSDDVVVWQHTLLFLQKATHLNKHLDYYPYVGHKHGVYGIDAVNLYQKLTEYFFEHL